MGSWLMLLAGPLAIRVLISLGIGIVVYEGVTGAVNTLIGLATSSLSALPAGLAQLAAMTGLHESLAIILGALITRLALASFKSLAVK